MFCPYCLKQKVKIHGEKTSERAVYIESRIAKGKDKGQWNFANIKAGFSPLTDDKRLKNDFNKSRNQKWRFYKCPRCKGFYKTKETIEYYCYAHVPKQEDIDRYDSEQVKKKVDGIIKGHLKIEEYPVKPEKRPKKQSIILGSDGYFRTVDKKQEIKDIIVEIFGKDITEDLEKDLMDLYQNKQITSEELYRSFGEIRRGTFQPKSLKIKRKRKKGHG